MAHLVADAIVKAHLATMWRLDMEYDVLPRESEILHLQILGHGVRAAQAAQGDLLRDRRQEQGLLGDAGRLPRSGTEGSKVIVRSNGTVTYVGKDIAYQLWKFGLLGKDFHYLPMADVSDGHDAVGDYRLSRRRFRPAFRARRESVQRDRFAAILFAGRGGGRAARAGLSTSRRNSVHFSYEMVALSPRTCVELGIPLSEEDKRPYVEVSGPQGAGREGRRLDG